MTMDTSLPKGKAGIEASEANVEHQEEFRTVFSLCPKYDTYWWNVAHLRKTNIALLVPLLASYVSGFDGSMMNGLQSVPAWQEGELWERKLESLCS